MIGVSVRTASQHILTATERKELQFQGEPEQTKPTTGEAPPAERHRVLQENFSTSIVL